MLCSGPPAAMVTAQYPAQSLFGGSWPSSGISRLLFPASWPFGPCAPVMTPSGINQWQQLLLENSLQGVVARTSLLLGVNHICFQVITLLNQRVDREILLIVLKPFGGGVVPHLSSITAFRGASRSRKGEPSWGEPPRSTPERGRPPGPTHVLL